MVRLDPRWLVIGLALPSMAFAAGVCPSGGAHEDAALPGVVSWTSYRGEVRRKQCIGSEIHNISGAPLAVSLREAGIAQAVVQDRIEVALCCFDGEQAGKASLHYGTPTKELPVTLWMPAEEGLEHHQEGYPDLIEEEARVRTVSIRGSLRAGEETLRIDLLLKCSASRFAKQFAYQFSLTDRSTDPVDVDWDLLRNLRAAMRPSVQPIPNGKTYIFLSAATPRESEAVVEVKTKSGLVAGRFRFDAFTASAGQ